MILLVLVLFPFISGLLTYETGVLCQKKNRKSENVSGQENVRDTFAICFVMIEFLLMAGMAVSFYLQWKNGDMNIFLQGNGISFYLPEVCGFGMHFVMDGFRLLYASIVAFMWMMVTILSREYFTHHKNRNRFYLFLLWTLGATMGVFLSGDLYTTFIFFEIMSFTSYVWVVQEENRPSIKAAETYLAVAVIGGLVMLMGIFLLYHQLGTVEIAGLPEASQNCENKKLLYIAGACMLFGFGAKVGAFPLHIWLPKAHPVAPAPASALLSGILTKTGIYGTLILSCYIFYHDAMWGKLILGLGVVTMFLGALLAVFSMDLKHTLACSSMSQVGFILVGIGMQGLLGEENALAVHGVILHMMNHSMIKLVLFMAAGVIYMNTHALDLNKIRGFGRKKPLLAGIFLVGALAIGGIPMFGGYVSKTLLHESIVEYAGGGVMTAVEWIFLFSGGLTVAYMTKLFVALFIEKNKYAELQNQYDAMKSYMNGVSGFALTASALVLFVWGLLPHVLMEKAANLAQSFMNLEEAGQRVNYFNLGNLKGALISIVIGVVVYFLFIRQLLLQKNEKGESVYINVWPKWMDLESLVYRPLLLTIFPFIFGVLCRILDSFVDSVVVLLRKTIYRDSLLPHERLEGNALTVAIGRVINGLQFVANHTWRRNNPTYRDYIHLAAVKNEELKENNGIIQRSLSFGLMLAAVGLTLTLIYIVWW